MSCLWCEKDMTPVEAEHGNLCPECEQVSRGLPRLTDEQLDKLPFGIIELDRSGRIIKYNQTEEARSGVPKVKVVGRNFFKIAPCTDVREFRGRFESFLDGNNRIEHFDFTYYFETHAIDVQITFLKVSKQLAFVLSKRIER